MFKKIFLGISFFILLPLQAQAAYKTYYKCPLVPSTQQVCGKWSVTTCNRSDLVTWKTCSVTREVYQAGSTSCGHTTYQKQIYNCTAQPLVKSCALGVINCPAFPSLTLVQLDQKYLGAVDSVARTNELSCIRAGQKARNECRLEAPSVVVFSINGQMQSATLLRRFQRETEVNLTIVPPPAPSPALPTNRPCAFESHDAGTLSVPFGGSIKAYNRSQATNTIKCLSQMRTCESNALLTGTYAYKNCNTLN